MRDTSTTMGVPADRRLPGLARACDGIAMAPLLSALGAVAPRVPVDARIIKYVAGKRCVIAYTAADGSRVIGKMYRKDRARAHAELLTGLGAVLSGATHVARVHGCVEALGLVVQQWVPGDPVPEYAAWTESDAVRLGTALAELHAAPLAGLREADLLAHERRTCHPGTDALGQALPEAAPALARLRAAIDAAAARPGTAAVTSHGDFGPRAVFAHGVEHWIVDLDGVCRTDPAFDVATVQVGLRAHRGEIGQHLGDRFAAAYADAGGRALPTLGVHTAFCEMRRAMMAWRRQGPDWAVTARAALARAVARLD